MKRLSMAAATILLIVAAVAAANQMYQLEIYEWLRFRDDTLITFGTSDDFYGLYASADDQLELRSGNDGELLVVVDHDGLGLPADIDVAGQIEAGSGNHTLTNAAGLIDGGKIQDGTITGAQVYAAGLPDGAIFYVDTEAWTAGAMSGHGTLDGDGALTVQTYTWDSGGTTGLVPDAADGTTDRFLCVDGTWSVPSIGAVGGPGSSTDNAVMRWDGTDGDTAQNSLVLISDGGAVTIPGTLTVGSAAHLWSNTAGLIDGGKLQDGTVTTAKMSATGVVPGSYTVAAITIDAGGRITAAANGSLGLIELDDGETDYDGAARYPVVVNALEDGWEFASELDPAVLPVFTGDSGSGGVQGAVPAPGVGDTAAGKFLFADGSWATPSGTGNVAGPATSTDNALALYDGVDGQQLQDSNITSPDGDSLTIPGTITAGSGANVLTNSAGLIDGGKIQAGSVGIAAVDIATGTTESTADDDDLILIYDNTASANRVMTRAHFLSGISGGAGAFTDLTDTPANYTDSAGKFVRVNVGADGLEFATVSGTGGGPDTLCRWRVSDATPHPNYPAQLDTRNSNTVLDFDASTDETMYFDDILPRRYGGGGVVVEIHYSMTSATSGDVVWSVAWENQADEAQDIDSDGFASAKTVTHAVSDTSGKVKRATISFSDGAEMDSVGAGDLFRMSLVRDADNASDTATGDAEVRFVHVYEYEAE